MTNTRRPWLLIDVDGVLNRVVSNSVGKARGLRRIRVASLDRMRYTMHIDPGDGPSLLALADLFDLAWCTTWQGQANGIISRTAGLPYLPVVTFDLTGADRYSKVPGILRFVGDRPFVWIDDDVADHEASTLRSAHPDHAIIRTNPVTGLEPAALARARAWATGHR